jgi:hypothetical protein
VTQPEKFDSPLSDPGSAQFRPPTQEELDETEAALTASANVEMMWPAPGETAWSGMIAPYGLTTGDSANVKRMFKPGTITHRATPFSLLWQPTSEGAHAGAVIVGRVDEIDVNDPDGIWAMGVFFDPAVIPEATQAMYLLTKGVVGPSVDLDDTAFEVFDADTGQVVHADCGDTGSCPVRQVYVPEQARVSAVTLVAMPAFSEMGHSLTIHTADDLAGFAADAEEAAEDFCAPCSVGVRQDWAMPFANRARAWDAGAAVSHIATFATRGGSMDWDVYARGFLVTDGPADVMTSYRFPIATVVDEQMMIVPQGVDAAAAHVSSPSFDAAARESLKGALDGLYARMAAFYEDDDIQAPWATTSAALLASVGNGIFTDVPAKPIEAFRVKAIGPTPVMITDEGQIWGHLALWNTPHRGYLEQGANIYAPRSRCEYREFLLGATRTTAGLLPTGKLVLGGGHADGKMSAQRARRWYDEHAAGMAEVNVEEDEWGPFMSGWLLPGVDAHAADEIFRNPPSGDWRMIGGSYELIAALGVNVPGFPVPRVRVVNGRQFSVVSAGVPWHLYQNHPATLDEAQLAEFRSLVGELDQHAQITRAAEMKSLLEGFHV